MTLQTCVHRAELVTKARKRQLYEFSEFMRLNAQASQVRLCPLLPRRPCGWGGVCVAFGAFLADPLSVSSRQLPTCTQSHQAAPPSPGGRERRRDTVLLSPGGVSAVGPTARYLLLGINYPQLSDFPTVICIVARAPVGQERGGPSGDRSLHHVTEHPRSHVWCRAQLERLRGVAVGTPRGVMSWGVSVLTVGSVLVVYCCITMT